MAAALLFLLEYVPGFENALNSSLGNFQENFTISQCDETANEIWIEVLKNFKGLRNDLENSIGEDNNFETYTSISNFLYTSLLSDHNLIETANSRNFSEYNLVDNDIAANYLVAIFETMSNLTAQTCGGVLLTSDWVLTVASCLDVLPKSYPDQNSTIHYTIIANSSNPLSDGSVHNVTDIILHSNYNKTDHKPHLALMKISPSVNITPLKVYEGDVLGLDVIVYGWSIYQNSTDLMGITAFSATVVHSDCKSINNFKSSSIFCLLPRKNTFPMKPINSGGPVVAVHTNKLFLIGLALIDSNDSYVISVNPSTEWLNSIVN